MSVYNRDLDYVAHVERRMRPLHVDELVFFASGSPGCWNVPLVNHKFSRPDLQAAVAQTAVAGNQHFLGIPASRGSESDLRKRIRPRGAQ